VFFSSRRRHTRFSRDWSSDVCSSDLTTCAMIRAAAPGRESPGEVLALVNNLLQSYIADSTTFATCFYGILDPASGRLRFANAGRSEERRVGQEGGARR